MKSRSACPGPGVPRNASAHARTLGAVVVVLVWGSMAAPGVAAIQETPIVVTESLIDDALHDTLDVPLGGLVRAGQGGASPQVAPGSSGGVLAGGDEPPLPVGDQRRARLPVFVWVVGLAIAVVTILRVRSGALSLGRHAPTHAPVGAPARPMRAHMSDEETRRRVSGMARPGSRPARPPETLKLPPHVLEMLAKSRATEAANAAAAAPAGDGAKTPSDAGSDSSAPAATGGVDILVSG